MLGTWGLELRLPWHWPTLGRSIRSSPLPWDNLATLLPSDNHRKDYQLAPGSQSWG